MTFSRRRKLLLLATIAVTGLLLWWARPYLWPHRRFRTGSPGWTVARVGGDTQAIDEASGLVPAHRAGSFWTHDDSFGPNAIFRLDTQPALRLGLTVETDASNRDWEDITAFTVSGERWLVVADTGNNLGLPRDVRLWLLREPADTVDGTVHATARRVTVRLPGATPDIESVVADEAGGALLMLSKREQHVRLFSLPLAQLAARTRGPLPEEPLVASEIGHAGLPPPSTPGDWPTGLALSADGRTAVVMTYHDAIFWHRKNAETWSQALLRRHDEQIVLPFALERPEGVALSADGQELFVVGEETPLRFWHWRAPLGFRLLHH